MAAPALAAVATAWVLALTTPPLVAGSGHREVAVLGYVPEYRFGSLDWQHIVESTTHILLFSVEPSPSGSLVHTDRVAGVLSELSPLVRALEAAGSQAPKVLLTIGGAGRSRHFAAATSTGKTRKKLAASVAKLLEKHPLLAGVDLDWESPENVDQWRDLGNAVKEIRTVLAEAGRENVIVTMAYHARTGAVDAFSSIKGKKSDKSFVDLFDICHAMAYTQFDGDRRHSSDVMDAAAIKEWIGKGLPPERLSLGVPFFGVDRSNGETLTYEQLLERDAGMQYRLDDDTSADGRLYYIGPRSMARKALAASKAQLGGVTVWELGQDAQPGSGLLAHLWAAARFGREPTRSWRERVFGRIYDLRSDHAFGVLAAIIGAYLLVQVFTTKYPRDKFPPPPVKPRKAPKEARAAEFSDDPTSAQPDDGAAAAPGGGDGDGGSKKED